MKPLRVLALVHEELVPPPDATADQSLEADWKMEYDVLTFLRSMGHEVLPLGVGYDLPLLTRAPE